MKNPMNCSQNKANTWGVIRIVLATSQTTENASHFTPDFLCIGLFDQVSNSICSGNSPLTRKGSKGPSIFPNRIRSPR